MKKIIFILFIPFFLFADSYFYNSFLITLKSLINTYNISGVLFCDPSHSFKSNGFYYYDDHCHFQSDYAHFNMQYGQIVLDGKLYSTELSEYPNVNINCIKNNSNRNYYGFYEISQSLVNFCINKDGYIYSIDLNAWIPNNSDDKPICPSGKEWNSMQEKCIDDFKTQRDKCYKKCGGEGFTKNFSVNSDGSSICECKLCKDIKDDFIIYCNAQGGVLKNFSCTDDGEKIVSLSPKIQSPEICLISDENNQSDLNNSSNNLGDDLNNTSQTSSSTNNTNASSSNASNNSNNNQNNNNNNHSGNADTNQNNNSNKVDCCKYFKSGHGSWVLVNGCLEYTIPETGQNCRIKDDGLKCYECSSGSSSDSNSSGSINDIVTKINQTNSRLDKINNTLNDIINMQPDKNYDEESKLSSDEKSLFSGITDTISNIKKSLSDLTSSAEQVKQMLQNPQKFTLFQETNIKSCPIVTTIYKKQITVDICEFISPYRPILQLFFTLIFSFSAVFYFFNVILKGDSKK